jgi:hypothetical protein
MATKTPMTPKAMPEMSENLRKETAGKGVSELEQLVMEKARRVSELGAQREGVAAVAAGGDAGSMMPTALEEAAMVPSIEAAVPGDISPAPSEPIDEEMAPSSEPAEVRMNPDVVESASAKLVESRLMDKVTNTITPNMKEAVKVALDKALPGMLNLDNPDDLREAIYGIADGSIPVNGQPPGGVATAPSAGSPFAGLTGAPNSIQPGTGPGAVAGGLPPALLGLSGIPGIQG